MLKLPLYYGIWWKKKGGGDGAVFVVIRVLGFCVKLVYKLATSVACYRRRAAAAAADTGRNEVSWVAGVAREVWNLCPQENTVVVREQFEHKLNYFLFCWIFEKNNLLLVLKCF